MTTPPEAPVRPTVALLSMGGTIAMAHSEDTAGGVVPALGGEQLVAAVPGLRDTGVELVVHDFRQLPGASLQVGDVLDLAAAIDEAVADGAAGVVVTQGTDTIEETAFLLDLVHRADAPVVVTGAMRNPMMAGADGPANLLAAVRVAASPVARGLGCLVVMSDEIHAARFVRKVHSTSTKAFASPNLGPIGQVVEGTPRLLVRPHRGPGVPNVRVGTPPRVALVTVALGDDGELLRSIDQRFAGLVVAAFGVGHVPAALAPILGDLAARIPLDRGLVSAGFLDPFKARLLLQLLLMVAATPDEIARTFDAAGRHSGESSAGAEVVGSVDAQPASPLRGIE